MKSAQPLVVMSLHVRHPRSNLRLSGEDSVSLNRTGAKRPECRFYAELNDFLPRQHRFVTVERLVGGEASVKDLIESAGVPHTEVDLLIVNSESVDFTYRVHDGVRIAVYPQHSA
jgi:hypothetical protein